MKILKKIHTWDGNIRVVLVYSEHVTGYTKASVIEAASIF